MAGGRRDISLGRIAVVSMCAAVAVLALSGLLVLLLRPTPGIGLAIAGAGLVGSVVAARAVSLRMVDRAIREAQGSDDEA